MGNIEQPIVTKSCKPLVHTTECSPKNQQEKGGLSLFCGFSHTFCQNVDKTMILYEHGMGIFEGLINTNLSCFDMAIAR